MFKVGTRVILIKNYPDGNESLIYGDTGTVISNDGSLTVLIRWDKKTLDAISNDWLCEEYANESYSVEDLQERLWWVSMEEVCKIPKYPPFRKQKRGERILEYRITKKIYELDMRFKEKHDAKTNSVSVQDGQRECTEVSVCPF